MKRTILILCAAASLVLSGVPASAGGGASHISVAPNPVEKGETLTVTATDCIDGDDWEAKLHIEILRNGNTKLTRTADTDPDGTTEVKIKIRAGKFRRGEYTIVVRCKHHFDDGTVGTWYRDTETFRVKRAG